MHDTHIEINVHFILEHMSLGRGNTPLICLRDLKRDIQECCLYERMKASYLAAGGVLVEESPKVGNY